MKTIADNIAIPIEKRLDLIKKAKGGSWYDGWTPYCTQVNKPCPSRLRRMEPTDYGYCCKYCGDMIGFDLKRVQESPLNNIVK